MSAVVQGDSVSDPSESIPPEQDPSSEPWSGEGGSPPASERPAGRFALNDQQKRVLAVALVVHLVAVVFTLRDLRGRPAAAVRGPKWLWAVAATLNTSGSVGYWFIGRRRRSRTTP